MLFKLDQTIEFAFANFARQICDINFKFGTRSAKGKSFLGVFSSVLSYVTEFGRGQRTTAAAERSLTPAKRTSVWILKNEGHIASVTAIYIFWLENDLPVESYEQTENNFYHYALVFIR